MDNRQRWQEIDRIFAGALEREPIDRAAFLDEACSGDEQLRKEVDSLLAHNSPGTLTGEKAVEEATRLLAGTLRQEVQVENIGPYEIIRTLGSGGMGHVYLAHDRRLNRPVAVKLLAFYDAAEDARIRRFRQEALAASALNHPNILTIYEIGEFEGHNYIATEFVDGQTLLRLIESGPILVDTAVDIAIQVASALSAAHAAGIVHRDIKPANIMVRADGLVKVLDFGIAKYTQREGADQQTETLLLTTPGAVIGTAAYMSPEQARGISIDPRSDIWSLGVTLYEMLTGRMPFQGETPLDLMSAVIERDPSGFSDTGLVVPADLERIVFKALKKDREARYQTANEVLADLKALKKKIESAGTAGLAAADTENRQTKTTKLLTVLPLENITAASASSSAVGTQPNKPPHQGQTHNDKPKTNRYALAGTALAVLLLVVIGLLYTSYGSRHPPIESIAVMPFVNDSGNSEVEYLSDGMTDMLITSLSQLPKLSVKARSSVFRYKGKDALPQQLGKELKVQAVLIGHVVQRGNDLALHIELVEVQTETALWSGDYSRSMTNLVALQSEIARDVSRNLRTRLSGVEVQKVAKDYTENAAAYQLYLKGRFHVFKLTPDEIQTGISYLQQAIQLDPNYALAYVGLAEANRSLALGAEMTPGEFLPKSRMAAQKAIDLDDALADAHTALGVTMFWYDWNWNEAEAQYKRALELNHNSADAHLFYAHLLSNTGRHIEALSEIKRARELDPYSPFLNALDGQFLLHAGKPDEALVRLRETYELAPSFWFPHLFAASVYIEKGMFAEAIGEARRAHELSASQTVSIAFEGYALAKLGKREEALAALDGLLRLSKQRFVPPYHIALLYNGLGERDQALTWLELGFAQRDPKMAFLKVEPKWNNLRHEPRFLELLRQLALS